MPQLLIADLTVDVVRKPVRRLRLAVLPPLGQLRVTAPGGISEQAIREAVLSKQDWIRKHQAAFRQRLPAPGLRYESGETHYYQGQALRLCVQEQATRVAQVALVPGELHLTVPAGTTPAQRAQGLDRWRRAQLQLQVAALAARWEPVVGAQAAYWGIKQMKTRWGSCSISARRIWLNLELSQWPPVCLEYVVVHELTHLHERLHNARFWHLLGQALPAWRGPHQALRRGLVAAADAELAPLP